MDDWSSTGGPPTNPARVKTSSNAISTCLAEASIMRERAMTTRSQPRRSRGQRFRNASRTSRRTRLRRTALPRRLLAMIPNRTVSPAAGAVRRTRSGVVQARPSVRSRAKSASRRKRSQRRLGRFAMSSDRLRRGQPHSASGAAALQDPPPTPGRHATQETVHARTAALLGLVGSLGHGLSVLPEVICPFIQGKIIVGRPDRVKRATTLAS